MKNIHILPTDKPSRLLYFGDLKELTLLINPTTFKVFERSTQHIYITSDEEIKEEDWCIDTNDANFIEKITKEFVENNKHFEWSKYRLKIILTTDQDLIKDGVQGIDDEFLEWFVNNPKCEFVEFKKKSRCCGRCNGVDDLCYTDMTCDNHNERGCETCYGKRVEYKIAIPQEEPKQEFNIIDNWLKKHGDPEIAKQVEKEAKKLHEQSTLKEAAERIINKLNLIDSVADNLKKAFIAGAKWKAERTYSEEEVKNIAQEFHKKYAFTHATKWDWFFEQFKKK